MLGRLTKEGNSNGTAQPAPGAPHPVLRRNSPGRDQPHQRQLGKVETVPARSPPTPDGEILSPGDVLVSAGAPTRNGCQPSGLLLKSEIQEARQKQYER